MIEYICSGKVEHMENMFQYMCHKGNKDMDDIAKEMFNRIWQME